MPDGNLTVWHSSRSPILTVASGLHVGTLKQAQMRGGACLHEIVVRDVPARRMRDRSENQWRPERLRAARRGGFGLVVYLNRAEGIPMEEFERAREEGIDVDGIPDAAFRRAFPSARDSWIVLEPDIVRMIAMHGG